MWSSQRPSYQRIFGCLAFTDVSKELGEKLGARTTPCIFLGDGDDGFGYRLWDPVEMKVIRSQDAVLREDLTIEDIKKPRISSSSADRNPDTAPAQITTDMVHEEITEAEPEEAMENVEQGETQPGELQPAPSEDTEESVGQGEP